MVYITGDTHGDFLRIADFCYENGTTKEDIMIILGDAGINYYLDRKDELLKEELAQLPITLFCIHGNHEERPEEIGTYDEIKYKGGIVYREDEYPNILFAKDGEIYDFDGKKTIVIGGAYSVDKYVRLRNGGRWFDTEQPSEQTKMYVEKQLEAQGWRVDRVLTHTVPKKYEPMWAFLPGVDQSMVDKSTEEWLEEIEEKLDYDEWFAGHYHVESQEGSVRIMFEDYEELY